MKLISCQVLLTIIVLCGIAFRFSGLDRESFWFNEAASFHYANGSSTQVIAHSFTDETNPPGFHLLIHFWMKVAGISEWGLRLPSAMAGCLTLIIMAYFARFFLSRDGVFTATTLLAFAPLHIWYSQECRAFAIWLLFILLAYVFFLRWTLTGRYLDLVLNSLFIFLATGFHYFGLHAILVENFYLAVHSLRRTNVRWRTWLLSMVILAVCLLPYVIMIMKVDKSHVAWWRESGVKLQVLKSLLFHLNGVYYFLTPERGIKFMMLVVNALMLAIGLKRLGKISSWSFLPIAIGLPVVLNMAYSLFITPILGNSQSAGRYFLMLLPPYLVLIAAGWESVAQKRPHLYWFGLFFYLVLSILGIRASHQNIPFTRDDNSRLFARMLNEAKNGELIIVSPYATLDYYAHRMEKDLRKWHIIQLASDRDVTSLNSIGGFRRIWCYFDPLNHFDAIIGALERRYGLTVTLVDRGMGLSGAGLVLLEHNYAGATH